MVVRSAHAGAGTGQARGAKAGGDAAAAASRNSSARQLQTEQRWNLYPQSEKECYDRWVFAFTSSSTDTPAGEPLSTTRARLQARGWVEVQAPSDSSNDPSVVLSEPLSRPRSCDFYSSLSASE
eukprot:6054024-Prymnesium_polylepis.1